MIDNSKEALLRSMRRTLALMESAGIPKEMLVAVLETAAKELRAELAARGKKRH